jgi:hypothetical protein
MFKQNTSELAARVHAKMLGFLQQTNTICGNETIPPRKSAPENTR